MRSLFLFCLLGISLFSFTTFHVSEYPQDYFRSPVNHAIYLSGTFGELRPNHFHAGIDIKSRDGNIGEELYAIADGFVSRIKVSSGGYGNVLYIQHPNGYTSVYAHLDRFPKEIDAYVKNIQYERQIFEVDLNVEPDLFSFEKGAVLGWMGLSGRSFGPHLHFEIRDTETEKPINPLLFGLKIMDNIAPKLHELKVYFLNKKRETTQTKTYKVRKVGRNYRITGDTLTLGAWRAGFALKAYDHMNRTSNWNGVYSIDMYNNDSLWYNTTFETFAFDETRFINAHLDYEEQTTKKSYFNRCYQLPGNTMESIYNQQSNFGVISLSKKQAKQVKMLVKDTDGNTSTLEFWVKRADVDEVDSPIFNYLLQYDEENLIDNGSLRLYLPKGALYENLYLKYDASYDESEDVYSTVHHIHHAKIPIHKYFDLAIRPKQMPEENLDNYFIALCKKDNQVVNCGGEWKDGMLRNKVRDLGDYCIMADATPPKIVPKRFSSNMRGYKQMSFKITDNIPTARNVSGLQYTATIDNQWVLMEFDSKKDLLTHRFDDRTPRGEHRFRLMVTDACGNETVFERTFVR